MTLAWGFRQAMAATEGQDERRWTRGWGRIGLSGWGSNLGHMSGTLEGVDSGNYGAVAALFLLAATQIQEL